MGPRRPGHRATGGGARPATVAPAHRDEVVVGSHGHDIREGRQYRPVTPFLADLPTTLALRRPPNGAVYGSVEDHARFDLVDATELSSAGVFQAGDTDATGAELTAHWDYATRGTPTASQAELKEDKAEVRIHFERARSVIQTARITFSHSLRRAGAPRTENGA